MFSKYKPIKLELSDKKVAINITAYILRYFLNYS